MIATLTEVIFKGSIAIFVEPDIAIRTIRERIILLEMRTKTSST
jgi:hypothetical protein